ncbi:hypothetical protein CARUB_v10018362mg [Capsella rubella]|uniref:Uncharacterized protein n=1 Tax=Capsella rubella TaxID=81985 RepID=R0H707_9BRAS|nr:hypothetical protein CARUB_v10018362mg [Capsella rubella]
MAQKPSYCCSPLSAAPCYSGVIWSVSQSPSVVAFPRQYQVRDKLDSSSPP